MEGIFGTFRYLHWRSRHSDGFSTRNHIRSTNYIYECHNPLASSRFADSLKYLKALTYPSSPNITYCDDGRKWTTQRCSVRNIALCVNCDNPCQDPGATFLNNCGEDDIVREKTN